MDDMVFGIDLGTTYSAISTLDDHGQPMIIENFYDSAPFLASAVFFPEGGGDPVVGRDAKSQKESTPDRVVEFAKREIGVLHKDESGTERSKIWSFDGQEYDPVTISSLILKRLKTYADEQGYDVQNVVITCPAYFDLAARTLTKQAGEIAGFNVLNIVNEPTAAALHYCAREFSENRKILVYDLGGGTFDVSIVRMSVDENGKSKITVLCSDGDRKLGGVDWDARLYDYVLETYCRENGVDPSEIDTTLEFTIKGKLEDVKMALSNLPNRSLTIAYGGDSTQIVVTRDEFESLTKDLLERTINITKKLLSDAGYSRDDIDTVLLVGGSTMMPMVKKAVEDLFPGDGKVRRFEPNLAVAKGAALAAAIGPDPNPDPNPNNTTNKGSTGGNTGGMMGIGSNITFKDILPTSFGPAVFVDEGYRIDNLLFKGDDAPSSASKDYGTMVDNQVAVSIPIYENGCTDRVNTHVMPSKDECEADQYVDPSLGVQYLGKVYFQLPAGTPKGSPIRVTFNFSTAGLDVTAENLRSGESFPVHIQSKLIKSQEEIEAERQRIQGITTTGQT